ncbi:unnamed protein product [Protopolystoma xenopodis]|uniref:Uncharacterized protein n=1 Tax=Protopolystoma xenopodis TaxID=117903 RepID=A0A448WV56_9PLAT|nr:unnamed protein product [Protopolystoma xenopodis]
MENAKRHVITSRNQSSRRHVLLSNGESCVEEPMRRQSPRIRSQSKCSSSSGSASSIPHPSRPQPQIRSSSREWSSFGDKTNSTSHNTSVIRLKYQREWQRSRARELNSGHPSHSSGRHQRRREDSYQRYENSLCDDDSVNRRGHTQMASNYGNSRRRHITSPDERQRSARNHSRSSYSYGKRGSRERDIRQAHGKHGELGEVSSTTNSSPFINSRSMTSHHIQKMSTNRPRPSRPDNSSFRSHAISPSHHQSEQGVNKLNRYHHGYSNSSDLYTNPNDARERVSMSSNRLGTEFSPKRRFESNIHSAYSLKVVVSHEAT